MKMTQEINDKRLLIKSRKRKKPNKEAEIA